MAFDSEDILSDYAETTTLQANARHCILGGLTIRRNWGEVVVGQCTNCSAASREGFRTCAPCARRRVHHTRLRRARSKALGRCKSCPLPVMPGRTRCKKHSAQNAVYANRKQKLLAAKGFCRYCGQAPSTGGYKTCAECRKRRTQSKQRERRKANESS